MRKLASLAAVFAFCLTGIAMAQDEGAMSGELRAPAPTKTEKSVRLIPVAGAASFNTDNNVTLDNFDDSFSVGVFADFGKGPWALESGFLSLRTRGTTDPQDDTSQSFAVDSWGIPVVGKYNFTGDPQRTVFLKGGVMPFIPAQDSSEFNVMGVAGIGGSIPLNATSSFTLDASYNRIIDETSDLGSYQGVALLAGISFGL